MTTFEAALLSEPEKERLCRDLLSEFGAQKIKGGRDGELIVSCVLPWHEDRHPSAALNFKKLTYNCFSCGSSGGLLWFIASCRGQQVQEAKTWLVDQTGIGGVQDITKLIEFIDSLSADKERPPPMPKISQKALVPWAGIHPYLLDGCPELEEMGIEPRRIPLETLELFKVCYNPDTDRVVIPHEWNGVLVGWQTRRIVDDGLPKYLNSPDFPRDRTIYNFHAYAKTAVLVESPMSVLSKWHVTPHIEATFGAEVTVAQLKLLQTHQSVILFMDNDDAGWRATELIGEGISAWTDVRVAFNPFDADVADFDDDVYQAALEEAVPYSLWQPPATLLPYDREVFA